MRLNIQRDKSLVILALTAIGLLVGAMVKGFSPESTLQLAGSSAGRIALHVACSWRDYRFLWHWRGIQREFNPSLRTARDGAIAGQPGDAVKVAM